MDDVVVVVGGAHSSVCEGERLRAKKNPKTELAGSVSGVPCQTAV